jgi:hypothetical protein
MVANRRRFLVIVDRAKRDRKPAQIDDRFQFFSPDAKKRVIAVSPTGIIADGICPVEADNLGDARCDLRWESHARVGADYDGTLNKIGDFDEEWTVQLALPLESILVTRAGAGTRIPFTVERCEIAYDGRRACGLWGSSRDPAELVLE